MSPVQQEIRSDDSFNSAVSGSSHTVYGNGVHVVFLCRGAVARQGVFGEKPQIIDILCHPRTRNSINKGKFDFILHSRPSRTIGVLY